MVKELSINELSEVSKVFLEVFSSYPWYDKWESDVQLHNYLIEIMGNNNSLSFGLYIGDELIGICLGVTYSWFMGREYSIKELCIKREFQGRGVGKKFISEVENKIVDKEITNICLMTDRGTRACEFYLRNAFVEKNTVFLFKTVGNI